jgi:hypothetical protein
VLEENGLASPTKAHYPPKRLLPAHRGTLAEAKKRTWKSAFDFLVSLQEEFFLGVLRWGLILHGCKDPDGGGTVSAKRASGWS